MTPPIVPETLLSGALSPVADEDTEYVSELLSLLLINIAAAHCLYVVAAMLL